MDEHEYCQNYRPDKPCECECHKPEFKKATDTNPYTWTVEYIANNGESFFRYGVKFYEIQDALMSLSRVSYAHGTEAHDIRIF